MPFVDGHADTLSRLEPERRSLVDFSTRGHSDLGRLLRAGVSMQVLAICVEDRGLEPGLSEALALVDRFHRELQGCEAAFPVISRTDLDSLKPGRVGFLLGLEGGAPLCGQSHMLRIFFRLGLRLLGLTWNNRNSLADGVMVADGGGLTPSGRDMIRLAGELGVLIDLAHLGPRGFWEAVEMAEHPMVVSHANAGALCGHRRNLSDEQIRAVAAIGGLVGVTLNPPFLTSEPTAGISHVLRHLEHLISVAGPEAVGFGLDFDGIERTPEDLRDISDLPRLLSALARLGLDEAALAGIMGRNWLRVLSQVLP